MYNFRQVLRCPKCLLGTEDVLRRYVQASEYRSMAVGKVPEHIKVTCIRCTFSWDEHCVDSEEHGMDSAGIHG